MTTSPIPFDWDGDVMMPNNPYWAKRADQEYVIGQKYVLVEHKERSQKSHNHYFASIHEAWLNLPETISEQFMNEDHLRKRALIATGYCDEDIIVASSNVEAVKLSIFAKKKDPYSVTVVKTAVVVVRTAKTQNTKAMDAKEFQKSKDAVLDYLSAMVGTTPEALSKNARTAA